MRVMFQKELTKMRSLFAMLGLCLTLCACNTIAGIGEDVQSVGETVSDAAT